ncbi:MAG: BamA/TamA family outer membrane protein [Candidatus Eisenbacteria bacterium]
MRLQRSVRAAWVAFGASLFLLALGPGRLSAQTTPSLSDSSRVRLWVDRPLEAVEVVGLDRTRDFVVRRELRAESGSPVKWSEVESDRLRLLDTGLFADVRTEVRRDSAEGRPVLTYALEERFALALLPRLDYDPEEGWSYGLYFTDRNFRGRAERLSARGAWGQKRIAAVGYGIPWVAGRRLGLGLSLFISDSEKSREEIRQRKYGVAWSVSPARDYARRASLFGGQEQARTRPIDASDPEAPPRESEDHRWLGLQLSLDTREYRVQARGGQVVRVAATQHGGFLGGDAEFVRYNLDGLLVLPTPGNTSFAVASRASLSDGHVPTYLRQSLGGVNTLRGYEQSEFGGESRWIGWAELRVPVLAKRTFRAYGRIFDVAADLTAFTDVGSIWDGDALMRGEVEALWGGGVGLALFVPWVDIARIEVGTDGDRVQVYAVSGLRL